MADQSVGRPQQEVDEPEFQQVGTFEVRPDGTKVYHWQRDER